MFILHIQKVQSNWETQKRTERNVVPIIFNCVLCHVRTILLPVLTICSSWIEYAETIISIPVEFSTHKIVAYPTYTAIAIIEVSWIYDSFRTTFGHLNQFIVVFCNKYGDSKKETRNKCMLWKTFRSTTYIHTYLTLWKRSSGGELVSTERTTTSHVKSLNTTNTTIHVDPRHGWGQTQICGGV